MIPLFTRWRAAVVGLGMLISLCLASASSRGAGGSYFENFENCPNGRPANFVETPDANWWLSGGSTPGTTHYQGGIYVAGGTGVISSAISLPNVPGQDFTVTASIWVNGLGGPDTRLMDLALVVLGSNSDLTNSGYRLRYWVNGAYDVWGKLFLQRAEGTALSAVSGPYPLEPHYGLNPYTISLSGKYVNGALRLTGYVTDGIWTTSVTLTDNAPLSGTNFGFREQVSASVNHPGNLGVDWDDFSVMLQDAPGGDLVPSLTKIGE